MHVHHTYASLMHIIILRNNFSFEYPARVIIQNVDQL